MSINKYIKKDKGFLRLEFAFDIRDGKLSIQQLESILEELDGLVRDGKIANPYIGSSYTPKRANKADWNSDYIEYLIAEISSQEAFNRESLRHLYDVCTYVSKGGKKVIKGVGLSFILICIAFCAGVAVGGTKMKYKVTASRVQIQELEQKISEYEEDREKLEDKLEQAKVQLQTRDDELKQAKVQLQTRNDELAKEKEQNAKLLRDSPQQKEALKSNPDDSLEKFIKEAKDSGKKAKVQLVDKAVEMGLSWEDMQKVIKNLGLKESDFLKDKDKFKSNSNKKGEKKDE